MSDSIDENIQNNLNNEENTTSRGRGRGRGRGRRQGRGRDRGRGRSIDIETPIENDEESGRNRETILQTREIQQVQQVQRRRRRRIIRTTTEENSNNENENENIWKNSSKRREIFNNMKNILNHDIDEESIDKAINLTHTRFNGFTTSVVEMVERSIEHYFIEKSFVSSSIIREQNIEFEKALEEDRKKEKEKEIQKQKEQEKEEEEISKKNACLERNKIFYNAFLKKEKNTIHEPNCTNKETILLAFKNPFGQRFSRNFNISDPISLLYDVCFVDIYKKMLNESENESENQNISPFEIEIKTQFPNQILPNDSKKTISEYIHEKQMLYCFLKYNDE